MWIPIILTVVIIIFLCFLFILLSRTRLCCLKSSQELGTMYLSHQQEQNLCDSKETLHSFQIIGTHNSVHVASCNSLCIHCWRYTHIPITNQISQGIRHIELDIWFNEGQNKWELFHEYIDGVTNSDRNLRNVLKSIYDWSQKRKDHFPLILYFDVKGQYYCHNLCCVCYGRRKDRTMMPAITSLRKTITSIWNAEKVALPNEVHDSVCDLVGKTFFLISEAEYNQHEGDFFVLKGEGREVIETGNVSLATNAIQNGKLVRSLTYPLVNFFATDEPTIPSIKILSPPKEMKLD